MVARDKWNASVDHGARGRRDEENDIAEEVLLLLRVQLSVCCEHVIRADRVERDPHHPIQYS